MTHASLCFLSYNRPGFIEQAIHTATMHAGEPVEVIVHDDGSTDLDVYRVLNALQAGGLISTLITNRQGHNQGQGIALNRMFNIASGDPIIKLDQDLIFQPGWLKTTQRILEDAAVGLLGLFKYEHDPVDWRKTIITDTDLRDLDHEPDTFPRGHSYHTHICGSGFAIPRQVWTDWGPFAERSTSFDEDWHFQKTIDESGVLFNALPDEDLVRNQGFGLGPSTVVERGPDGQPRVHSIHPGPPLVGG